MAVLEPGRRHTRRSIPKCAILAVVTLVIIAFIALGLQRDSVLSDSSAFRLIHKPPDVFNDNHAPPPPKYAFVTYLAPTEHEDANDDTQLEDDVYYTSARLLAFQLLHDPLTRTNTSIPFVVLVAPQVSQLKRQRLEEEGATIIEFPSINVDWMKPGRDRWKHVMDKLNVFKLTQFEKVLLLDLDVVIFKRLDGIFDLPETAMQNNRDKTDPKYTPADEGPQPRQYIFAADSKPVGRGNHTWPAERTGILNAGFVVLHPSEEAFNLNLKVALIDGRTSGSAPENQLWEYIYRKDGNLPFSHLPDGWVMNDPMYNDYEMGIAAVHEKWWRTSINDKELRDLLLAQRWRMDGYWTGTR